MSASLELGDFSRPHRVWKIVRGLAVATAAGLVTIGLGWDQLTPALWAVVGICGLLAALMWGLTLVMQKSLRIEAHGLVGASAIRESVVLWSDIGCARVGRTGIGERSPQLIIEDPEGRLLQAYGHSLINRPLDEAARLINDRKEP